MNVFFFWFDFFVYQYLLDKRGWGVVYLQIEYLEDMRFVFSLKGKEEGEKKFIDIIGIDYKYDII